MARQMKDSGIEWIGEIPEDWGVHTASQLFMQVKNKNEGMQEDNLLSLSYGKIIKKSINTTEGLLPESFEGYNIIEPNDIVLRLTDLQNDHTSLRVGLSEQRGIITSAYLTLRNESDCFERYLYYQLHAFDICKGFYGMGAGVRQGLNWDGIKMLKIVRPTVAEQQRIAAFLDRKCAEIDAVIERTKATIEEYKKLKQAVITEAVTKGVRGPRPMKDSGIEWIGKIPEEWEVCRKLSYRCKSGISYGIVKLFDPDDENGVKVLRCSDVYPGGVSLENVRTVTQEVSNEYRRTILKGGEVIIAVRGSLGGCAVVTPELVGYNVAREVAVIPLDDDVYNKYVMYYLLSEPFMDYRDSHLLGSVYVGLNIELLSACPIIEPVNSEQIEIVEYLDRQCAALDTLIAKKSALLTELETYKKSLIYEYVTGKKEVL